MAMVSKFSNFRDELSENGELREFKLSGSDCNTMQYDHTKSATLSNGLYNNTGTVDTE